MMKQRTDASALRESLPWFFGHIVLLWQMRLAMTHNRLSAAGRYGRGMTALVVSLPALGLGFFTFWFMTHPAVSGERVVSQFYLNLLCFVTAMLWVLWPVLSAGVEDGSEKDRYHALPISDTRLLMAALISGLLRPVGLFMFAPLVGACVGYAVSQGGTNPLWVAGLLYAFIAMCATWSQLGVYWLRDVLRTRRSGETLTLFLLLLVLAGLLLPPVDVGWIYAQGGGLSDDNVLDLDEFANVAAAFSKIPPGYLGEGLLALSEHRIYAVLLEFTGMLLLAVMGLFAARNRLRNAHHRETATEAIQQQRWDIFSGAGTVTGLLARREAFELWRNPRVRLLITVPLVLIIVLHLVSANALMVHFFGPISQLWLMAGVALYGAALLLLTFTHNTFAYDGRGLLLLMSAPITPLQMIQAKARVHLYISVVFGVIVSLFYWQFVVPALPVRWWLFAALSVLILVPVVVSIGLWVSVVFPVKFDASLNRRERQPLLVSILGFGGCFLGALPFLMVCQWIAPTTNSAWLPMDFVGLLTLTVNAAGCWWLHLKTLPLIAHQFSQRQAFVLSAITRT